MRLVNLLLSLLNTEMLYSMEKILIPQNTTNIILNFAHTRPLKIISSPTRELEGVFEGKPVLLSRFEELLTFSILEDMILKMKTKQPISTLPALTFSDAKMMVSSVAE